MSAVTTTDWSQATEAAFASGTMYRLKLGRPANSSSGPQQIIVRPVTLRDGLVYQWAERIDRKEVHQNLTAEESGRRLRDEFPERFGQLNLFTSDADYEFRRRDAGAIASRRSKPTLSAPQSTSHDAAKQYLIPEGRPCAFLQAAGVMTADGRVRASMQHKFRQINRFLEFVNDIYPELPDAGLLRVVDFGCGKSYLTFAIHYLLAEIHRREVEIVGVDRSADVIATCRATTERLGLAGLEFRAGDISGLEVPGPVHLAVSLHACDTATDAALARAVQWQSRVILAVPCCQHEVAAAMNSGPLELLQAHGILRERLAALATDALRAAALEAAGYRTQVLEFIDLEHTAKNLLIRAVRRDQPTAATQAKWRERFDEFKRVLGVGHVAIEEFEPWKTP